MHARIGLGNFFRRSIAKQIIYSRLWWSALHRDVEEFVKRCDVCQQSRVPNKLDNMQIHPILSTRAFSKWGIDYVGLIKPLAKATHAQYIIVAIDYLTKWMEVKTTIRNDT